MNLTNERNTSKERRMKYATKAYKMWLEGLTLRQIAPIMGFSSSRIHQFIKEFSEQELTEAVDALKNKANNEA